MFDFVLKGGNASQLEKDIGSDMFPANEHFFGLVNVSTRLLYKLRVPHPHETLFPLVRQHVLLQLGAAGSLLLQAVPRKGVGIQGKEQEEQRDATHMPGRSLLLDRNAEEESWHHRAQEVHRQA